MWGQGWGTLRSRYIKATLEVASRSINATMDMVPGTLVTSFMSLEAVLMTSSTWVLGVSRALLP